MKPNKMIVKMVDAMAKAQLSEADPVIVAAFRTLTAHVAQTALEQAAHRVVERKWSEEGTCLPCQEVSKHVLQLIAMDILTMDTECPSTDSNLPA